jgi:hypothetical protein
MADPVSTLKSILSDNWIAANTDNFTPTFNFRENYKRIDPQRTATDYCLLYEVAFSEWPRGLGYSHYGTRNRITVELWTAKGRTHFLKMYNEVERICIANRISPGGGQSYLEFCVSRYDGSDSKINIWWMAIDCVFHQVAVGIS